MHQGQNDLLNIHPFHNFSILNLKSNQLRLSSAAPSASVASWQVSSVFLARAHYPGADRAPSIDKQQAVTALLLIHDTGEPGQCKADERDS